MRNDPCGEVGDERHQKGEVGKKQQDEKSVQNFVLPSEQNVRIEPQGKNNQHPGNRRLKDNVVFRPGIIFSDMEYR